MSPTGPTPEQTEPPEPSQPEAPPSDDPSSLDKTRRTSSGGWSDSSPLPATSTLFTPPSGTARTPFGPGNEPPDSLSPTLQPRYRLIRSLGQGGFANVYLAHDSVLDQEVAIKVLRLGLASQNDRDRFLMEARIGAKLRHPNIVTVFDIIQTPDGLQMVMEYYPGGTLTERIRARGPLHPREAIDFTRQVAQALAYAHRHNVIHRDVKPANVFLAGEGVIKLGDFGIASHSDRHEFTQTGMIIGTPLYMPPEQSTDSRDVDPRTDIYALGLTLYHMLTGRPPRVVDLESIPDIFRQLLRQSTAPERENRLVSCEQFIAMLDQIQGRLGRTGPAAQTAGGDAGQTSSGTPYTAPPTTTETALSTPTPTPLAQVTPTPVRVQKPEPPQPKTPPAAAPPPSSPPAPAQAPPVRPVLPPAAHAPARPSVTAAPPERPRRSWLKAGGALALVVVVAAVLAQIGRGRHGRDAGRITAEATPPPAVQATPAPTNTPTPTPSPRPAQAAPRFIGPGKALIRNGKALPGPVAERMQQTRKTAAEMMQRRAEEQRAIAAASTPAATPTASPTPAVDHLAAMQKAYAKFLEERPGINSALEIIRDGGGKDLPPPMREKGLREAQTTLIDAYAKFPDDPMMNLIVGFVYGQTGNQERAQYYFRRAEALDQLAGSPLGMTMENIREFLDKR